LKQHYLKKPKRHQQNRFNNITNQHLKSCLFKKVVPLNEIHATQLSLKRCEKNTAITTTTAVKNKGQQKVSKKVNGTVVSTRNQPISKKNGQSNNQSNHPEAKKRKRKNFQPTSKTHSQTQDYLSRLLIG